VLETIVGARRMIVTFTLSVLGGGLLILALKPTQLVVGASAGIFGVMTALYGISLRSSDLPPVVRTRLRRSLGATLLLNLFISLLPNVSLLGHAGGAIAGFALGASGLLTNRRMSRVDTVAAIACAAALAGSVLVALVRGQWLRS
jgi:membrane associated rhomboid family serine protease